MPHYNQLIVNAVSGDYLATVRRGPLPSNAKSTLLRVSEFARIVLNPAYVPETIEGAIETAATNLPYIDLREQALFFTAIFADPDRLPIDRIAQHIHDYPQLLKHADFWMLRLPENYVSEVRNYLQTLKPENLKDWELYRAVESFCDAARIRDRVSDLGELFWGKALEHVIAHSHWEEHGVTFLKPTEWVDNFATLFFQFPNCDPPLIRIGLKDRGLQALLSHPQWKKLFASATAIPHLKSLPSDAALQILQSTRSLKEIDLSSTDQFSLLNGFAGLAHLEKIDLSYTTLTDAELLAILNGAKSLKELNLSNCEKITAWADFPTLERLERINLSCCNRMNAGLAKLLGKTKNLEELDLSGCEDLNLRDLPTLPSLKMVNLSQTEISDVQAISLLTQATHLTELNLAGCTNIYALGDFPELHSLEKIRLDESTLLDEGLATLLRKTKNLRELSLFKCRAISSIGDFPELLYLERLNLNSSAISASGLAKLLRAPSHLKELYLRSCNHFLPSTPLPPLESVEIIDLCFSDISSSGFTSLLTGATHLKKLLLKACHNLFSTPLSSLPRLEALEELDLTFNALLDTDLATLIRGTRIKKLTLQNCDAISLSCDIPALEHLEVLDISGSPGVTDAGVAAVVKRAKHLRSLTAHQCTGISLSHFYFVQLRASGLIVNS